MVISPSLLQLRHAVPLYVFCRRHNYGLITQPLVLDPSLRGCATDEASSYPFLRWVGLARGRRCVILRSDAPKGGERQSLTTSPFLDSPRLASDVLAIDAYAVANPLPTLITPPQLTAKQGITS